MAFILLVVPFISHKSVMQADHGLLLLIIDIISRPFPLSQDDYFTDHWHILVIHFILCLLSLPSHQPRVLNCLFPLLLFFLFLHFHRTFTSTSTSTSTAPFSTFLAHLTSIHLQLPPPLMIKARVAYTQQGRKSPNRASNDQATSNRTKKKKVKAEMLLLSLLHREDFVFAFLSLSLSLSLTWSEW